MMMNYPELVSTAPPSDTAAALIGLLASGTISVEGYSVLNINSAAGTGIVGVAAAHRGARCVCVAQPSDLEVADKTVADNCDAEKLCKWFADALEKGLEQIDSSIKELVKKQDEGEDHEKKKPTCRELLAACSAEENASNAVAAAAIPFLEALIPLESRVAQLTASVEHSRAKKTPAAHAEQPWEEEEPAVEPVLLSVESKKLEWSNAEQMEEVESYTGGGGYDIILIADVLVNAENAREVLMTAASLLAPERRSVAYVAVEKSDSDPLAGICTEFGLSSQSCETSSSSVAIRALRLDFDDAGAPLPPLAQFDVVIEGTGMTEAFLSGALARAGYKVLHLERGTAYGGAFSCPDAATEQLPACFENAKMHVDCRNDDKELFSPRNSRNFLIDSLPLSFMANSDTIGVLVSSNTARSLEFQNVDRLLNFSEKDDDVSVAKVPLSRADIFKSALLSPMEMRRLMKFIKDMDTLVPTPVDDDDVSSGDEAEDKEAQEAARVAAEANPALNENFFEHTKTKYNLSEKVLSLITLNRALLGPHDTLRQGIITLKKFLSSVGRWGGKTPYLSTMYGCAEIPQNMCRVSAVWGGMFVLRRWVSRVDPSNGSVWLSNGQRIRTKAVVLPKASDSSDSLSRVAAIVTQPLVSWVDLEKTCSDQPDDDAEVEQRQRWPSPLLVGVMDMQFGGKSVPVHVVQQSATSQQAPASPGAPTLVHFTVQNSVVSTAELAEAVQQLINKRRAKKEAAAAAEEKPAKAEGEEGEVVESASNNAASVLELKLLLSFELREPANIDGDNTLAAGEDDTCKLLRAHTLFGEALLDDAAYVREAHRLFDEIVAITPGSAEHFVANPPFLEEVPEQQTFNAAEGDKDAELLGIH